MLSEAFYHLHGKRLGLTPVRARHYGICHWWLRTKQGRIIDFTAGQFTRPYPYHKGKGGGFLTKRPSRRARAIIELVR